MEQRLKAQEQRGLILHFALPYRLDAPPLRAQGLTRRHVPGTVSINLRAPVLGVSLGLPRTAGAVVAMPETSVHEDRQAPTREHNIRRARQVTPVQSKARAKPGQRAPYFQFGRSVLALDLTHDRRTLLSGEDVSHGGGA